jgi:hypothetical protein
MTQSSPTTRKRRGKAKRASKGSKVVRKVTSGDVVVHVKKRVDGRGWLYYAEYLHPTKGRQRPSLQTDDLEEAVQNAQEIADEVALLIESGSVEDLARINQSRVTLGQVFDEYRREQLPNYIESDGRPNGHWINMDRVIRVAESILGRDQVVCELGPSQIARLKTVRLAGGVRIPGRVLPDQFDRLIVPAKPTVLKACGPNTVRGEIAVLSVLFNWARRHKVKGGRGRKLLGDNPLHGIPFGAGVEEPKRPLMTQKRYEVMLHFAPEVEAVTRGEVEYQRHFKDGRVVLSRNPSGRRGRKFGKMPRGFLVTLLMLARGTWHRIESLRGLRVGDILLTRDQIRRKLLDLGWPEEWADEWPWGAVYWNPEFDKEGYSRVVPISMRLHEQLVLYLRELGTIDPNAWLFPSPSKPGRHVSNGQVWRWFRRTERVAAAHGADLLPLKYGAFHPFRRQGRSERAGHFDDKLIALCGGWQRFKDSQEAMNQGYLQYSAKALYLCVEFDVTRDVPDDGCVPGVNIIVNAPPAPHAGEGEAAEIVAPNSHTVTTANPIAARKIVPLNGLNERAS